MFDLLRMRFAALGAGLLFLFTSHLIFTAHLIAQPNQSHVRIELIPENAIVDAGKSFWVGLLFHLDPGWHVYWENPGDAGEPPKVQWQLPPGFTSGSLLWPQPVRLGTGSVIDYGYENQVLLMAPIESSASALRANSPTSSGRAIAAEVKYIVCREVCIPGKVHVTLSSSSSPQQWTEWRELFEHTRAQLPQPAPRAWQFSAKADKESFIVIVRTKSNVHAATFFPLEAGQIDNSAPQSFASTPNGFRLQLKKSDLLVKPVATLKGLLVLGPGRAFEIAVRVVSQ